jgi:hypothetical protein
MLSLLAALVYERQREITGTLADLSAPSTTPLPSTQMPQSAMSLVPIATGGPSRTSGCEFSPRCRG